MAFDKQREKIVLFGGIVNFATGAVGDTWEWDGESWEQIEANQLSARAASQMIYHASRENVLLYGGFTVAGPQTELWEWDGQRWAEIE